jgi:hypothetical protein
MAQDINALNQEIATLRRQLGDNPLTPFKIDELDKALLIVKQLRQEFREASGDLDYIAKSFRESVNELSRQNLYLNTAKKSISGIADISKQLIDYRRGETSLSEKQLKNLQNQARIKFEDLKSAIKSGQIQGDNLNEAQDALDKQEIFNKHLDRTIELQKQINQEIGLLGQGLEGAGKFLDKLGFGGVSKSISEAIQKTKDAKLQLKLNQDVIENINKLQEFQNRGYSTLSFSEKRLYSQLKERYSTDKDAQEKQKESLKFQNAELSKQSSKYKNIVASLREEFTLVNLTDALIAKTVDSFFKLNEAQTDFRRLTGNSITLQSQLNTQLITSVDYIKTAVSLTEKLGLNAQSIFPSDTLATAAEMVTTMGATQEQANQAAIFSKIFGKNLNDVNASIVKGTNSFNATNRSALAGGTILKDVYSTSTEIAVSLGKNPDRLAEAARQAKNLGLSLEQVDKIADSLLNVEQSIAAEFEAEVITGKQLNLEAARYYALTNQTDKLGKEIANNQNVISSFATDNRIEQEAIAKTLGLSRKELADMYVTDQLRRGLTAEQIAQNTNIELSDIKRLTIQESINKSIEKMTQLLAGPLEMFASLIDSAGIFYGIMGAIGTIITVQLVRNMVLFGIALGKDIAMLGVKLGLVSAIAAAEISGAMAATLGLGAVAIIAGIAAGIGAMKSGQSTAASNTVPGLAEGGTVTSGGTVMVGEKGPEMLSLKPGATVTPLTKLNAATVTQQAPQPTAIIDYEKLAQVMSKVTVQSNLDGVAVSSRLQTPMGIATRRGIG